MFRNTRSAKPSTRPSARDLLAESATLRRRMYTAETRASDGLSN